VLLQLQVVDILEAVHLAFLVLAAAVVAAVH
jgi:hypothetical protein